MVLAFADTLVWTALGAGLWGLQLGLTQGLLGATIADIASERLRGTAYGIFDVAVGVTAFAASAGAGTLWMIGGSLVAFAGGAIVAAAAGVLLLFHPVSVVSCNGGPPQPTRSISLTPISATPTATVPNACVRIPRGPCSEEACT
jgi:hypothetical protein